MIFIYLTSSPCLREKLSNTIVTLGFFGTSCSVLDNHVLCLKRHISMRMCAKLFFNPLILEGACVCGKMRPAEKAGG